ncbi:MAG TPA: LLM class flavin-dependent oxidoreductase [Chloroflexota bacterium]|nr:LLM class flavin-dependent oxidoreductase [Chloroflexota bacterium]
MDFGLVLPTVTSGATPEGIEAAAEVATRLGWSTVWATDHVLVHKGDPDYGFIYGAVSTLAYVGGRYAGPRLGASVINVPLRNAVVLAKELASLDALTRGRLLVGVGLGDADDIPEFRNLGVEHLHHQRGAFLDETIRLWRHLWSGSTEPFEGRFYQLRDYAFGPLPVQGARLPVLVGGRSPAAYRRAGALSDGYHATRRPPAEIAEAIPHIRAAAEAAGRPMPLISVRARVRFNPAGAAPAIAGSPADMLAQVRAYQAVGVQHLAFLFDDVTPEGITAAAERLHQDVLSAV